MSARLDQEAVERQTAYDVQCIRLNHSQKEHDDARLRYIREALAAGWSWARIGKSHRQFWERNRQRAGRV